MFADGVGEWSEPLIVTTDRSTETTPTEGPTVVTTETVTTTSTSVTVGWTLPRTTLEVLRFELRWRPSTENAWPDDVVNIPSTEPSHTITGLAPDTEYAVQVRAVFADGVGEWSEPLIVTTDHSTEMTPTEGPPQPTIVAPTLLRGAVGPTSVTVTWTLPPTTLDVLRFELRWRPSADDWTDDVVNILSTESSHTITGLAPDTEYAVQVRAVFASSGEGPWSLSVTARTAADSVDPQGQPEITISNRGINEITEAANGMQFLLNASQALTADLRIIVRVTETGGPRLLRPGTLQIETSGSFEQFVDLGMNEIGTGFSVQIVPGDTETEVDPDSTITATVLPGTGYTVGTPSSASVTVTDNDS